jgi:hypothetical protein
VGSEGRQGAGPWMAAAGAALLIGVALIPYGPGMTPDSVHYLSAAENLRHGKGYATSVVVGDTPSPRPIAEWPPLYPGVLAAATALGGVVAGPWTLNALLLAASTWQVARLAEPAPLLGALAFAVSPAVVSVHGYAWSEPLFLFLAVLSLKAQEKLLETPGGRTLVTAAALTGLACLTRYLGVTLAVSGALALAARRRPLHAFSYAGLSVVPLSLWLLRNWTLTGSLAGKRAASGRELPDLIREVSGTLGGWLVPVDGLTLRIAALLVAAAILGWVLFAGGIERSERSDLPWLAFAGVYLVTVTTLASAFSFDPLSTRLLAPIVPALAVPAARRLGALARRRKALASALAVVLLAGPTLVTVRELAYAALVSKGRGYRAARWRETEAIRLAALRQGPFADGRTIYSDAADVLSFYSERPVRYLPRTLEELDRKDAVIVLAGMNPTLPGLIDAESLRASPRFRVERTLGAGAVLVPAGDLP